MTLDRRWSKLFRSKKSSQVMLSQSTKLQEKFLKPVGALPEPLSMTLWVVSQDSWIVVNEKFKKENKLFTLWLYIKSTSSTPVPKASWLCFQELLVKSHNKSDNRSTRKFHNGENKARPKSFPVSFSLMRSTCWTWSASLSLTEPLKARQLQLWSWPQTGVSQTSEAQTTKGNFFN